MMKKKEEGRRKKEEGRRKKKIINNHSHNNYNYATSMRSLTNQHKAEILEQIQASRKNSPNPQSQPHLQ